MTPAQCSAPHSCGTQLAPSPPPPRAPPQWSSLANLTELNLTGCDISGSIPWGAAAPFAAAPRLVHLSRNRLVGTIPPELAGVEELLLDSNSMSGPIPAALAASPALRVLAGQGNAFNGSLPSFAAAGALRELRLARNALGGPLPDMPPGVTHISLSHNPGIGGGLPPQARARARSA